MITSASNSAPNEDEFRRLCEFLYRRTGMLFNEGKRYFVERRLSERMQATGSVSFASYLARLQSNASDEIQLFVNAFTVNETYFYREDYQLQCLVRDLLPARLASRRRRDPLRIWSVPCSTGEEPYSIAMWLLEKWAAVDTYDIEIVASDIDTAALAAGREGIFGARALMRLDPPVIEKYFNPIAADAWRIIDLLRQSVRFTAVNLIERSETNSQGRFDVIFCRNVLIYFDEASRRVAAENLFESLMPGGFLCLGHAESMSRISPLFEVKRFPDAIVYQRPQELDRG